MKFIREAGGALPVSQKILNMPRNVKNVPMKKGSFLCISRTNFFLFRGRGGGILL